MTSKTALRTELRRALIYALLPTIAASCEAKTASPYAPVSNPSAAVSRDRVPTPRDPPGDVLLGVWLNQLMDRIQQAITQATNAGLALEVKAGSEAYLAIQEAQVSLTGSLNTLIKNLNDKVSQQVATINQMMLDLEKQTAADAMKALDEAQQIALTIPLSDKTPQLRTYSPHLIARDMSPGPSRAQLVPIIRDRRAGGIERSNPPQPPTQRVDISGLFWYAAESKFTPTLVLQDGTQLSPVGVSTQLLTFLIPLAAFDSPDSKRIAYATFSLQVPYKGGIFDLFRYVMTYRFIVGTVPSTPGQVTLTVTTTSQVPETRPITTEQWHQTSDDGDDHPQVAYCGPSILPQDRWVIQPDTVNLIVDGFRGGRPDKWDFGNISDTNPHVCYWVSTVHKWGPGAVSGEVWFHIVYTLLRYNAVSQPQPPSPLTVAWGQQIIVRNPGPNWQIRYVSFDGTIDKTFGSTDLSVPYLHVQVVGDDVQVSSPSPDSLGML